MESRPTVDTDRRMIRDLRTILEGWEFEPGRISVRKIIGRDGREKIQTRVDLGVLQLECAGRPDGQRPHGHESLLEYHEQRRRDHVELSGDDEDFILSPEDCRDLRHEAYLYYQRYLSLFVLEEYEGVEQDTARNLRLIDFCERYGATEEDRAALRRQRAYVLMMQTRAKAYRMMQTTNWDAALGIVEQGVATVATLAAGADAEQPHSNELQTLHALRREILEKMPGDMPAKLQSELESAVANEDYERAAALRDRLAEVARSAGKEAAPRTTARARRR